MITVLFPSRKRPVSLTRTIDSLLGLAERPRDVYIYLAIDEDDGQSMKAARAAGDRWTSLDGRNPVRFIICPQRYGYSRQQEYYNAMAPAAGGDWLFVLGDDAIMQTECWDRFIREQEPRPAVLWPQSNGYPYCFPIVPAPWARELGRFSPSAHPDSYWYSVGKGLDRHVEIPVSIFHDRKDLTGGHDDATYAEGRGMLGQTGMADDGGAELVAKDVEVLRRLL